MNHPPNVNLKKITAHTPPPERANIMYTNLIIRQLELPGGRSTHYDCVQLRCCVGPFHMAGASRFTLF